MVQVDHENDEYRKQSESDNADERVPDVEDEKAEERQGETDWYDHAIGLYFGTDADSNENQVE